MKYSKCNKINKASQAVCICDGFEQCQGMEGKGNWRLEAAQAQGNLQDPTTNEKRQDSQDLC